MGEPNCTLRSVTALDFSLQLVRDGSHGTKRDATSC